MKITTTITVAIERPDGTDAKIERTTIALAGDNPRFERREVAVSATAAASGLIAAHDLTGSTEPL